MTSILSGIPARDAIAADLKRRIAVLPIGYGDGFPRVRNEGCALIHGQRAPLIGGIAMDALMVDITDIPEAHMWDEAVLMGRQGSDEITVHDLAKLKNSVSYDVLTSWRLRLRRVCVNGESRASETGARTPCCVETAAK